jgi:hypothetical protein
MKPHKPTLNKLAVLLVTVAAATAPVHTIADVATELAKKTQNPVSDLISVPFENNANFNAGPDDKVLNVLNIKPVVPIKLNDEWNLINRAIIPVISQPGVDGTSIGRKNGVGDITYEGFFSPNPKPGGLIWGVGPQIQIPTHTNSRLGNQRWAAGPNMVVLDLGKKVVKGFLLSQIWDVTNSKDEDISFMTFQPFYNYNFGKGWYAVANPVITADWEADGSDQWTVPIGGGVGRVMHWGKQAVNLGWQPSVTLSGRPTVLTTISSSLCNLCFQRGNKIA